ncbi:hypothetical protein GCM10020219_076130 [Nonomuraea dietziae]
MSAIWASRDSTGWQAMNISASRSSSTWSGSHSRSVSGAAPTGWPEGGAALSQVPGEGGVSLVEGRAAAEGVDRATPAHGEQPSRGIARDAVTRPGDERLGQ